MSFTTRAMLPPTSQPRLIPQDIHYHPTDPENAFAAELEKRKVKEREERKNRGVTKNETMDHLSGLI